ncbi:MAG: nucleoid-associated protein [Culicoidibacterales bacterium]
MYDLTYAKVEKLVVHHVGAVAQEEGYFLSKNVISDISEIFNEQLQEIFLAVFSKNDIYHFTHENELKFNQLHVYAHNIFADAANFLEYSEGIVRNLYAVSGHPNIKSGDLWVIHLSNCVFDGSTTDAVGIFKVEDKDFFIKNDFVVDEFSVSSDSGITRKNVEKGCLIFDAQFALGHRVLTIDRLNRQDSLYWKESFLNIRKLEDEKFMAENFAKMFSKYVANADEGFLDKAVVVKATTQYLEEAKELNVASFIHDNFDNPEQEVIFKQVFEKYEQANGITFPDTISLEDEVRQKLTTKMRKIVKLSPEISIVIKDLEQLDESYIEKGFDEVKGKKFIKVYYD